MIAALPAMQCLGLSPLGKWLRGEMPAHGNRALPPLFLTGHTEVASGTGISLVSGRISRVARVTSRSRSLVLGLPCQLRG